MDPAQRQRYLEALGLRDWEGLGTRSGVGQAESPVVRTSAAVAVSAPVAAVTAEAPAPVTAVRGMPEVQLPTRPAMTTLDEARSCVAACTACRLHETRTNTVFGVGPATASLMVVGEGPGAEEDARGEPFVGRAGKLLDQMLAAIGHGRGDNAYIANVVKCRPPNNRDPQPDEAEACRDFLEAQIRLIQPKLILAVGRVAAQRLLQTDQPLSRLRGQFHAYGPEKTPLWITYHPAYLLRSPREKAKAWVDLKQVHAFLAKS
jgi:uracil-DNA glycosylase family 4